MLEIILIYKFNKTALFNARHQIQLIVPWPSRSDPFDDLKRRPPLPLRMALSPLVTLPPLCNLPCPPLVPNPASSVHLLQVEAVAVPLLLRPGGVDTHGLLLLV